MNTKEYQSRISDSFIDIFEEENVKREWDSLKDDPHLSNHKEIYGPRLDVAVGPFNSFAELDTGMDSTEAMKEHPFTKRIVKEISWDKEDFNKCWNNFSRCYLAIEIELSSNEKSSNSLKHILGSIINASVTGSIGIIITDKNTSKKVDRLYYYLLRLRGLGRLQINTIDNLIRIDKDDFIAILSEVKEKLKDI
jgi:hypothetical protein